jgi:D-glycero-D-manno-heptose 1,7-bisphosphate phosphatase
MDRDGTVSEEIGYMYHAGLYRLYPWTAGAIRRINENGMKAVLITNQSGVGRGYFDENSVVEIHRLLSTELAQSQAKLDAIYYCPHRPDDACECRKPRPGMLLRAQDELNIDLQQSYVIGDKHSDVVTASAVGAKSVLVLTGYGREELAQHRNDRLQPGYIAENLMHAVDAILKGNVA